MKKIIGSSILFILKIALKLRYKVEVKGLENLNSETLNRPGGVLFLPNHPAVLIDPTVVTMPIWKKYPIRPLIVEYLYYAPIIHPVMKMIDALPVPNFDISSNSLKKEKNEKALEEVIKGLKNKENFLIYPAGQLKDGNQEIIGGSSGVYRVVQNSPEANIVLVRTKGLYGSIFSRYYEGKTPKLVPTLLECSKYLLQNLIFFTPRRKVIVEYFPAPKDFPRACSSKLEFNRYLENWYNTPDGLTKQEGEYPGDSTVQVSYSLWGNKYKKRLMEDVVERDFDIEQVPPEIKNHVILKLAEMTKKDPSEIKPEMDLARDIGLDSLDTAELATFLHDQFDVAHIPVKELTTVGRTMGIAAKQIKWVETVEEVSVNMKKWTQKRPKIELVIPEGVTVAEVFLNNSRANSKLAACADDRTGILTYHELRLRALILADYIKNLPGKYIGIFLPASTAAFTTILACEIAGKIPMPINWTIGSKHLKSVVELSNVQVILSSWLFLDRLENVDLFEIQDKIVMLEDVRRKFTLSQKIKAKFRSMLPAKAILKIFNSDKKTANDVAVLLFTSGTESLPKGVPLTNKNLLSNLKDGFKILKLYQNDVIYSILPPFHSFGFNVSGLSGLLSGMRVVFYPNPNDGPNLAKGIKKWGVTVFCGAPNFIKTTFKSATTEQLQSLRLTLCGAEKATPDVFEILDHHGKLHTYSEGYGITECSPIIAGHHTGKPHIGVGLPIPNVELLIIHEETLEPLPPGSRGMILTRGPNVFPGYINPGIASPFLTVNGVEWYKTGDLGFLDVEGFLTISGRLRRFVKIGGEMISLPALEESLLEMTKEKRLNIDSIKSENGPILAISTRERENQKPEIILFTLFDVNLDEVNRYLRETGFSNLAKISSIVKVKEIPLLGSGKTNYRLLQEIYLKV